MTIKSRLVDRVYDGSGGYYSVYCPVPEYLPGVADCTPLKPGRLADVLVLPPEVVGSGSQDEAAVYLVIPECHKNWEGPVGFVDYDLGGGATVRLGNEIAFWSPYSGECASDGTDCLSATLTFVEADQSWQGQLNTNGGPNGSVVDLEFYGYLDEFGDPVWELHFSGCVEASSGGTVFDFAQFVCPYPPTWLVPYPQPYGAGNCCCNTPYGLNNVYLFSKVRPVYQARLEDVAGGTPVYAAADNCPVCVGDGCCRAAPLDEEVEFTASNFVIDHYTESTPGAGAGCADCIPFEVPPSSFSPPYTSPPWVICRVMDFPDGAPCFQPQEFCISCDPGHDDRADPDQGWRGYRLEMQPSAGGSIPFGDWDTATPPPYPREPASGSCSGGGLSVTWDNLPFGAEYQTSGAGALCYGTYSLTMTRAACAGAPMLAGPGGPAPAVRPIRAAAADFVGPPRPPRPVATFKAGSRRAAGGMGTELKALLASLGITGQQGCGCDDRAARMDAWGLAGCKARRAEILDWLDQQAAKLGWWEKAKAGALAVLGGLPLTTAGLFDEAARRAKAKAPPEAPWRWVSTAEMISAAVTGLLPKLPDDLAGVCGVTRSGMLPAAALAAHLHLPLWSVSQHQGDPTPLSPGSRGALSRGGRLVIVDDTVYSGAAMRGLRHRLGGAGHVFAAVYARPEAADAVDVHGETLPSPHLLEWNLFNSGILAGHAINPALRGGVACDFDGVLCEDLPPGVDEAADPAGYAAWLADARPLQLPRRLPVPLVVTFRRECHRAATLAWCARWGVRVGRLVMHPSAEPLRVFDAAAHKGLAFRDSPCALFVESDPAQAQAIARVAGKPVACPAAGRVFAGGV